MTFCRKITPAVKLRSQSTSKQKISSEKIKRKGKQQMESIGSEKSVKLKYTNEDILKLLNKQLLQQQDYFLNQVTLIERKEQITQKYGLDSVTILEEQHKWTYLIDSLDILKVKRKTMAKNSSAQITAKSRTKLEKSPESSQHDPKKQSYVEDQEANGKISLIHSNIANLMVDAIVCTMSVSMIDSSSSYSIIQRGGESLRAELDVCKQKLAPLAGGSAFITCGYELPAHYIIWACVTNENHLTRAYMSALKFISDYSLKSIAFTCIGTGGDGTSNTVGATIALRTIRGWLNTGNNVDQVDNLVFCTFNEIDYKLYLKTLPMFFPPVEDGRNFVSGKSDLQKTVALSHAAVQPADLSARLTSRKLLNNCSSLDLSQAARSISDWFIFALKHFAGEQLFHIQSFNLTGSKITDTSILLIAQECQKLKELIIDGCFSVTEQSVCNLLEKHSLKKLSAYGCSIRLLPWKSRQKFDVVTESSQIEQRENNMEQNNYLKIIIPRTGRSNSKSGAETFASLFTTNKPASKFTGLLNFTNVSGQIYLNLIECDIGLLHMFTGPRAITVLIDLKNDDDATKRVITTSLNSSAISFVLATSYEEKELFDEIQATIKSTASESWQDWNSWIFADKINAESILRMDFQRKCLIAQAGADKAAALLQSSNVLKLLQEESSSSELPKDITKLIEKHQKDAKVAKGNPNSPDLFVLQITGHIVLIPNTDWYFNDLNFMKLLFNSLYKIKNGTKNRRKKIPWLAPSDNAFAITDVINIVRQKSGLNDIEEENSFIEALCGASLFLHLHRPWANESFIEPTGIFFSALPMKPTVPLETLWPSSLRKEERELILIYVLPLPPTVVAMLGIFQDICDIAFPTMVWRDGILANHFCCDILCYLSTPAESEKVAYRLTLGVRTLSIGKSNVSTSGENSLKKLLLETFKLSRQIIESALIKYKVYYKVVHNNLLQDESGKFNERGRYFTLSCTHEQMETGKCDPGVTNGRLFYNNSQCALCEATPIRWRRHMFYCKMCGLCDVCIQKLQMQSSTLNLLPVKNVWLLQNAAKQLTATAIFFSENSRFAIRALNDSDHTNLNFVGSFFDATLLRTQKTKQIVFDGAYFRDVLLQKASKEKDVDEVQVQKNSIHSTTSSAIIVLTSLAARVLLSAAAIKLNLRNSYLHTGMVLEYCREKTVDGQKVRQVYAATVVDIALIGSGLILSLFEIVNRLELKLVEKEQIVDLMKSNSIHPIGWADYSNLPLVGADSDTFEWTNFLSHTSFVPVPYVFFSEAQIENCPEYLEHKLKYLDDEYEGFASMWCPGMKLEARDKDNSSFICVATVIKVEQNNVTITFDGWAESYNYTTKAWSEDFHPIGYCDFVKHPSGLYTPIGQHDPEFDWSQYLTETKSVPVPYESFNENQKRGTPKHSAYFNNIDQNPSDEKTLKDTAETWKQILPTAIDRPVSITCNVASTTSTQHTLHGFDGFFITPSGLSDIYQMSSMLYDRRIALSFTDSANYQCQHFANQEEPIVTLTNVSLSELSPGDDSEKKQKSNSVEKFLSQLLLYATPVSWKKTCEVGFSGLVAKDANDLAANLAVLESINRGLRTLANTLLCLSFEDLANAQTAESTTTTDWQTIMQMVTKKCAEMGGTKANAIYSPQRELNVRFKHPGANDKDYTFEQLQLGFMPQLYATADENRTKSSHMGIDVDPKYNPEYLENLQFCEALNINNLSYWTEITAKTTFWNHRLTRINISNVPLFNFPEAICKCENLNYLTLSRTGIDSISENIGNLLFLAEFTLDFNRISNLPASLKKTKLEELSIRAIESYTDNSVVLQEFPYQTFTDNFHPFCQGLTKEETVRKRVNIDLNKPNQNSAYAKLDGGILEGANIQILNSYLTEAFPRLHSIPSVVFELTNLRTLHLTSQNLIKEIPPQIANLVNLNLLILNHCTSLEVISEQAGRCPLQQISVQGCQALRTPPQEVVRRGSAKIIAYLRRLLRGYEECKRTKLMVVGLGGAGKTSLVRALMSNQYQSDGTSNAEITDGIDIVEWNVKVPSPLNPGNRETINYSIWDFAGQAVYYNSHQFFLSNRAIYLLLWNARLGYEHAGLDFWLSSIACHAPLAPVFVVGTHADQVFRADLPMQDLQETFSQIVQFCNISVLTGQGVKELADKLFDVTLRQSYMGERVPSNWLQFEKTLLAKREEKIIPFQDMQQEAIESQLMLDSQDVKECLTLLHELGSIQYFNKDLLRSQIITNPQWLVDVMACLISVKENVIKNGRFKRKSVKTIWAKYPKQLHSWLLHLTEEFELTYALTTEKTNVVPCLLPETEPEYEWPELSDDDIQEMKLTYQFKYLPAGLFNRAQSRLCQYSDNAAVWKKGSLLHKNRHIALLRQTKDQELVLIVQGPKPENVLFLVHEVLETLILEFFHGVSYDLSIPCIDCVHMGSQDPHMFSLRHVKRAIDLKAPFLQCMKNFHIVAIDSLTSLLPPSSTADYERHITGMLHELKELSSSASAMVQVLVLCHALDSQSKKKEAITAKRLCSSLGTRNINASQLVIAGKRTQVELGTKLASCQVMIAVISEQFCKDQACADIFSFIKRNVKRPLVCAVIDANDQQWRSTIVGAIVSTEIYVNFNSTSHYDDKMDELLQRIKSKVQLSSVKKKKKAEEKFDVFISYSWLNSKDAVAKGLKEIASSLGEVDPREFYDFLEGNRIHTWLDIKCAREGAIFEEIADALRMSKIVLICVSEEYLKSKNCMMEFRFAAGILKRSLIVCAVGTGKLWQSSEVAILSMTSPRIDFQTRNENYFNNLLKIIGETLSANEKDDINSKQTNKKSKLTPRVKSSSINQSKKSNMTRKRQASEGNDSKSDAKHRITITRANSVDVNTPASARRRREGEKLLNAQGTDSKAEPLLTVDNFAYQELCELAQRKFLQQCSMVANECRTSGWQAFPHLVFLDCINSTEQPPQIVDNRPPTSASKEVQNANTPKIDTIFKNVGLTKDTICVRFLCEYDEGWHLSGGSFTLPSDVVFEEILHTSSTYLAALYSILQYAPVAVKILEDKDKSVDFITSLKRYIKENNQTDFKDSFFKLNKQAYRAIVQGKVIDEPVIQASGNGDGSEATGHGLRWYHTHSRKTLWLCDVHGKFTRGLVDADFAIQAQIVRPEQSPAATSLAPALNSLQADPKISKRSKNKKQNQNNDTDLTKNKKRKENKKDAEGLKKAV